MYTERGGLLVRETATFRDEEHLRQVIDRVVSSVGRRIDESSPMVDARLPDGSRVNAVLPPLALDGPLLTSATIFRSWRGTIAIMSSSWTTLMRCFQDACTGYITSAWWPIRNVSFKGLLEYCRLPFESQCLRFYENPRVVRTISSEQVRQPLYQDSDRSVATLRTLACAVEKRAGRGPRALSGGASGLHLKGPSAMPQHWPHTVGLHERGRGLPGLPRT